MMHPVQNQFVVHFLCLALGLSATIFNGCRKSTSDVTKNYTPTILPVEALYTTTQPEFSYPITFYGRIQAVRRSTLSFEIPGQVSSLQIDEGENIQVGHEKDVYAIQCFRNGKRKLTDTLTKEEAIAFRNAALHLTRYLNKRHDLPNPPGRPSLAAAFGADKPGSIAGD